VNRNAFFPMAWVSKVAACGGVERKPKTSKLVLASGTITAPLTYVIPMARSNVLGMKRTGCQKIVMTTKLKLRKLVGDNGANAYDSIVCCFKLPVSRKLFSNYGPFIPFKSVNPGKAAPYPLLVSSAPSFVRWRTTILHWCMVSFRT